MDTNSIRLESKVIAHATDGKGSYDGQPLVVRYAAVHVAVWFMRAS